MRSECYKVMQNEVQCRCICSDWLQVKCKHYQSAERDRQFKFIFIRSLSLFLLIHSSAPVRWPFRCKLRRNFWLCVGVIDCISWWVFDKDDSADAHNLEDCTEIQAWKISMIIMIIMSFHDEIKLKIARDLPYRMIFVMRSSGSMMMSAIGSSIIVSSDKKLKFSDVYVYFLRNWDWYFLFMLYNCVLFNR